MPAVIIASPLLAQCGTLGTCSWQPMTIEGKSERDTYLSALQGSRGQGAHLPRCCACPSPVPDSGPGLQLDQGQESVNGDGKE